MDTIKFKMDIISQAKKLFPDDTKLHELLLAGDGHGALNSIFSRLGFNIDEDDILRAFRNKKEVALLEKAKRAKNIRDLYQKIFMVVQKADDMKSTAAGYSDCI